MVKRCSRALSILSAAAIAGGCTSIVGLDQDYELDPGKGQAGSTPAGGSAGRGGSDIGRGGQAGMSGAADASIDGAGGAGGATGGSSGTGGATGGTAGSGGTGGASGGKGGSAGSGGAGATGGAAGVGGSGGASGAGGSSGTAGTGGSGGATGTGGSAGTAGVGGAAGKGGSGGAAGTGNSGGAAGTGGSAGTGGAAGSGGAAGIGGSAGTGGTTVDAGSDVIDGGDASADAWSDAASDGWSPCGPGTKQCGVCVPTADPNYGCAGPSCSPCEANGTATCTNGSCVVTGCNTGYHQVGNVCVPNVPEVCTNGLDDDGDTRADCLDADCVGDPSCVGKCMEAQAVACDTIVTAQSNGATGSTTRIGTYSCSASTYPGSEYAYRFTGGSGQRVVAELYGLSGNLGLFQIGVPSGTECVAGTSCGASSDVVATAGAEALGFTTQAGQDYYLVVDGPDTRNYSLSVQCTTLDGCWPVTPIAAGQSISATNNPSSGAANVTSNKVNNYTCINNPVTGPETAFIFTPTVTANYRALVSGLTADCELFVLAGNDCSGACVNANSFSDNSNTLPELVTFQGVANTTYYIVVDGYAGAVCNFNISLTQL
jgi:hypothetical protein